MSEELIQKNLVEAPEKMGDWNFYNIGAEFEHFVCTS